MDNADNDMKVSTNHELQRKARSVAGLPSGKSLCLTRGCHGRQTRRPWVRQVRRKTRESRGEINDLQSQRRPWSAYDYLSNYNFG